MAYSTQRAVSDGSLVLLNLSLDYFDRSEISVLFNNVASPIGSGRWSWVGTTNKQITFTPAVTAGVEITVKRTTQLVAPLHQYTKGAQFIAETLDDNFNQVLRIAQDSSEGNAAKDFFANVDFHGYQIKNLGNATQPQDALTLAQYQADIGGAQQSAASAAASAAFAATVNLGAYRNVLVNGDFRIAQRPLPTQQAGYTLDRWLVNLAGAHTVSQSGVNAQFEGEAGRVLVVVGSASSVDSNVQQRVEAVNSRHLAGKPVTLSCWLFNGASPRTVSLAVAYCTGGEDNFAGSAANAGVYSAALPTGWSRHVATYQLPTSAVNGLLVSLMGGFGALGAAQSYAVGNVQLEGGAAATPFERRPIGLELQLCQRYYETGRLHLMFTATAAGQYTTDTARFKVTKRNTASVTLVLQSSSNVGGIGIVAAYPDSFGYYAQSTSAAALAEYYGTFIVDAEL